MTVGKKPTAAKCYLDDPPAVLELLNSLSKVTQRDRQYSSVVDLPSQASAGYSFINRGISPVRHVVQNQVRRMVCLDKLKILIVFLRRKLPVCRRRHLQGNYQLSNQRSTNFKAIHLLIIILNETTLCSHMLTVLQFNKQLLWEERALRTITVRRRV